MKNKKILLLLIITILLIGCSETNEKSEKLEMKEPIQLVEVSGEGSTIYQSDNIKIKISDNIDEKESIYTSILNELQKIDEFSPIENLEIQISKQYMVPNLDKIIKCDTKFIETEDFKKQLIKKSYDIYDNWISEGLYTKIYNIEKSQIDFATYYSDNDFSLFGARFFEPFSTKEEIDNIKSASIDLVEYLLENNKKEELLKNNIKVSDIEDWAEEKSIDLSYQREIESLMNRMEAYKVSERFTINTKEEVNGFKIDISIAEIKARHETTEQYDTSEEIEQIILMFDRDILAIRKGIEGEAPNFYSEYEEVLNNIPKIEYSFETDYNNFADGGYVLTGSGKINLRDIRAQAHEYCHFLFHNPFREKGIVIKKPNWIDEGIANYLDTAYSEAIIIRMEDILYSMSDLKENFKEVLKDRSLTEDKIEEIRELNDKIINIHIKNNVYIDNIDEIAKDKNKRILIDYLRILFKVKFHEIQDIKLKEEKAPLDLMTEGDSMDYHKNFSFFNYLVEEYGLEKMLYLNVADFNGLTYKEYFGKTFEELKEDWINYLKENIKGIEAIL